MESASLRQRLFDVNEPFEISQLIFDKYWPAVSNVWASYSEGSPANGDAWKVYVCRLEKRKKSNSRQPDDGGNDATSKNGG